MRSPTLVLLLGILSGSGLSAQTPLPATTDDGRKVLLYGNNTWKFVTEAPQLTNSGGSYTRPASATQMVDIQAGSTRLSYDPAQWTPEPSTDRTRMTFQHRDGDGYALVIRERLQMSLEALKDIALTNALEAAPDARIVFEETRIVNGTNVLCLMIEGTTSGIAFTYFGYYYSGKSGIVQLVTYTGQNLFEEYRLDFENFLNGFEVIER